MKIRYYGPRTYCIGISEGHVENLISLEEATELHKKLGDILIAVSKAKAVPIKEVFYD